MTEEEMVSSSKRVDLGLWKVFESEKSLKSEGGEALEQAAQRCGGSPVPGDIQGQAVQVLSKLM